MPNASTSSESADISLRARHHHVPELPVVPLVKTNPFPVPLAATQRPCTSKRRDNGFDIFRRRIVMPAIAISPASVGEVVFRIPGVIEIDASHGAVGVSRRFKHLSLEAAASPMPAGLPPASSHTADNAPPSSLVARKHHCDPTERRLVFRHVRWLRRGIAFVFEPASNFVYQLFGECGPQLSICCFVRRPTAGNHFCVPADFIL
jgi:hypothetical protein